MRIDEVAPQLVQTLRELGDHYGPMGVALVAVRLTDPVALIHRMLADGAYTEDIPVEPDPEQPDPATPQSDADEA